MPPFSPGTLKPGPNEMIVSVDGVRTIRKIVDYRGRASLRWPLPELLENETLITVEVPEPFIKTRPVR